MCLDSEVKLASTRPATADYVARVTEITSQRQQFGSRLRLAREAKSLLAQTVADHFGISVKTVYAWEKGGGLPDAMRFRTLCRIYEANADELLWGDDPNAPKASTGLSTETIALLSKLDARQLKKVEKTMRDRIADFIDDAADTGNRKTG